MSFIDPALWKRLSPLLDEALELDANARAARVVALRAEDAALADALEALLHQGVGSSRVDLQACKLEYSIVSPK